MKHKAISQYTKYYEPFKMHGFLKRIRAYFIILLVFYKLLYILDNFISGRLLQANDIVELFYFKNSNIYKHLS